MPTHRSPFPSLPGSDGSVHQSTGRFPPWIWPHCRGHFRWGALGWGACTAMGRGVTPSPPSHTQTPGTARSPWTRALASQPGFRVVGYRVSQGLPPSPGELWGVERMGVLVLDPPVSTTHLGTTGGREEMYLSGSS